MNADRASPVMATRRGAMTKGLIIKPITSIVRTSRDGQMGPEAVPAPNW